MMKWQIPAKTFLVGEYAAIAGGPALLVTSNPCFELNLVPEKGLFGIHPESPAGKFWLQLGYTDIGLKCFDPYQGQGGMGASSAQFLGAYLASRSLQNRPIDQQTLLETYLSYSWQGQGVPPSGYDVLAQANRAFVYINRQQQVCQAYDWPFPDLAFILLHTGKKLATHHHLHSITLPKQINQLAAIVETAKAAFAVADGTGLIEAVNAYHGQLKQLNLVCQNSLDWVNCFKQQADILAAKGCGALGADVLLLLVHQNKLGMVSKNLASQGWNILATSAKLYVKEAIIENNLQKTLEISS